MYCGEACDHDWSTPFDSLGLTNSKLVAQNIIHIALQGEIPWEKGIKTGFVGIENITCAPASNDLPVGRPDSQSRRDYYRQIRSIDMADIIEINITKSELGNGAGRVTSDCEISRDATVTCLTFSSAVFIKTPTGRFVPTSGLPWQARA
ncbi:hypothetical protein OIU79_011094 [Salix purpurea]|uniref:Uncharacterized protein n=1 Tax=Salix purpurea TaxID=77065 RepID=A0A9Q0QH55_SALPP|nr:hypothetical protein OIU79_011094 [Salix purpurea]